MGSTQLALHVCTTSVKSIAPLWVSNLSNLEKGRENGKAFCEVDRYRANIYRIHFVVFY